VIFGLFRRKTDRKDRQIFFKRSKINIDKNKEEGCEKGERLNYVAVKIKNNE